MGSKARTRRRIKEDTLVVGIDVAKRKHVAVAEFEGHTRKPLRFDNDAAGFEALADWLERSVASAGATGVVVGLESTGVYGRALELWLLTRGIEVYRVPTFLTRCAKEMLDRSPTKSDPKDAAVIADLVRQGKGDRYALPAELFETLRTLGSLRYQLAKQQTATLNRLHRVLDQIFPELPGLFEDLAQPTCRALLRQAPTPARVLELGVDALTALLHKASRGQIRRERAQQLLEAAGRSVGSKRSLAAHQLELEILLNQLDDLDRHIARVEADQVEAVREVPYAEVWASLPGISLVTVATLLGETGDVRNFQHSRQLVKLAGLNLKEHSSGEKKGKMTISRRGRPRLRHALYLAVVRMVAGKGPLHGHHARLKEHKPGMVSMVAGMRRLLRVLFALAREGAAFDPSRLQPTAIAA